MAATANQYKPDYAVPPGWILAERLEAQGTSQAEFARRCGRSPKLISQIIAGDAPVAPVTALQFEKVLGVDARIWLGIQSDYELHLAREAERQTLAEVAEWAEGFPIRELVKRGMIEEPFSHRERGLSLLSFLGVGSLAAWKTREVGVAYRHSPSFASNPKALATWLRLGEIEAEAIECLDYNKPKFEQALSQIRGMTANPADETLDAAQQLCREAGVALTIIKPLSGTALSGAARWLTPHKAAIHLSARHMSDDHLWFSFFHEAAHILLHNKKDTFVHDAREAEGEGTEEDTKADRWASNFLVRQRDWEQFTAGGRFGGDDVTRFAAAQGIAPGIIVGRLQHEGHLPWSDLNQLKKRLKWHEDSSA